jgi:alcohol dehydrogenase class IV
MANSLGRTFRDIGLNEGNNGKGIRLQGKISLACKVCHVRSLSTRNYQTTLLFLKVFVMKALHQDSEGVRRSYDLTVPPIVRFGSGRIAEVGSIATVLGNRIWLVLGKHSFATCGGRESLLDGFHQHGLEFQEVAHSCGEPTVQQLAKAVRSLPLDRENVVVVAVGGGSTIDYGKALSALATNIDPDTDESAEEMILDRLEGVGRGIPIDTPPLPFVAVPTTAGTGAEATRNAVLSCPKRRFKKSLRSTLMVPRAVVLDPSLIGSCNRNVIAASGIDCLTQLIESFICRSRWSVPRALVLDAFPDAMTALPRLLKNPLDKAAQSSLVHAAFISGVSLGNSGLGLAHGVAAAIGVECGASHGLACAALLPVALRVNQKIAENDLARLNQLLGGEVLPASDGAQQFVERVIELCRFAGTPTRLSEFGLKRNRIPWVAEHSGGNSMRGNPVQLSLTELVQQLESVF